MKVPTKVVRFLAGVNLANFGVSLYLTYAQYFDHLVPGPAASLYRAVAWHCVAAFVLIVPWISN